MIELIRLIRQFGLRRILYLSKYEKWLIKNLYEEKSLRNIDLDNDGVIDGFRLKIKNPLYSAYYRRPRIVINKEEIDTKDILLKKDEETLEMKEWTDENPLPLIPGQSIEIIVRRSGGLRKGKHMIKILNARIVGFDTSMNLEFVDEV